MSFYWVNVGDTHKEVEEYKFLWAPSYTVDKRGRKIVNAGWKYVSEVVSGDIIFCHNNGSIVYIAIAKSDAFQAPRPSSRNFDKWKKDGYKIDVDLEVLGIPITTNIFKDELIRLYNDKCRPKLFSTKQEATEQYMISIPDGAGITILETLGEIALDINDKVKSHTSPGEITKPTQRTTISQARVGQGKFRDEVLQLWNSTCPVTKVNMPELLIASHIVSWQISNDEEKLDKYNGLPLSPGIDKLFDKGYVSFSDSGQLLINARISEDIVNLLGIDINTKIEGLTERHKVYLRRHRETYEFTL